MFVVLTFIALVASFSIVSNLIMLVTEKAREVAILKSMGARDGAILRVFFAEGLYIGAARAGAGPGARASAAACCSSRYGLPLDPDVYYIQKLPVVMRGQRDRGGRPGGAGPLLPGDPLPGAAGLPDAPGRRSAVRVRRGLGARQATRVAKLRAESQGLRGHGHGVVDTCGGADYFGAPHDDAHPPPAAFAARGARARGAHVRRARPDQGVRPRRARASPVLRGLDFELAPGRDGLGGRRLGRRQVDAAAGPGHARRADRRARSPSTASTSRR